jgi:predicted ChrR family anti-sigma factor
MNWHEFLDDDLRELASLHVMDALEGEEARAYRLHLAICRVCRAEVDSLARTAAQLIAAVAPVAPPPGLWNRVLERIRAPSGATAPAEERATQPWKQWHAPAGMGPDGMLYAPSTGEFEPTSIEGIEVRKLAVDAQQNRVTMLVRMAAGTRYPAHRHGGPEECFVLQGDIRVGDLHMRAGDFQRAEHGSVHGVQSTDGGCLLLIVSSMSDDLI